MPDPWEPHIQEAKVKILTLEKELSDLVKEYRENPQTKGILEDMTKIKDEITKLNLRLEAAEKKRVPVSAAQEGNNHGDIGEDEIWPC